MRRPAGKRTPQPTLHSGTAKNSRATRICASLPTRRGPLGSISRSSPRARAHSAISRISACNSASVASRAFGSPPTHPGCFAQRRAPPQTGRDRLRRRGAAGRIGEGEAVRRPGEAIARPQVDVETEDGLAALGAKADQQVGRAVDAVGQQEQHRRRPRRGRRISRSRSRARGPCRRWCSDITVLQLRGAVGDRQPLGAAALLQRPIVGRAGKLDQRRPHRQRRRRHVADGGRGDRGQNERSRGHQHFCLPTTLRRHRSQAQQPPTPTRAPIAALYFTAARRRCAMARPRLRARSRSRSSPARRRG